MSDGVRSVEKPARTFNAALDSGLVLLLLQTSAGPSKNFSTWPAVAQPRILEAQKRATVVTDRNRLALGATVRFHRMMAAHALVYYGWFDHGFGRLNSKERRYWKKGEDPDTERGNPVEAPPANLTGIQFGFMQTADGYLVVKVDDLVLRAPVLFIGTRHGPAAPGPGWSELTNDVAARILADCIVANPERRDVLADAIRRLGPRTP